MSTVRTTWRPKFKVDDYARVVYRPRGTSLITGEEVRIIQRAVKARARDPRQNRYLVRTIRDGFSQDTGWLYEDDLEAA